MKTFLKEIGWVGLSLKQKAIVFYFAFSFMPLCIGDDSPIWLIVLVVLNFANAARLIKKVPLPELNNDYERFR